MTYSFFSQLIRDVLIAGPLHLRSWPLRLPRPLLALLELVSPGLLDVFQYLAVKLLLGILHLEYLGGWKDLFELLKVLFFKFSNTDVGIGLGIEELEALLIGCS